MITIKVNGNEHEVEEGVRLVNAIEDFGYDISHRCGGKAKCTTCRVTFHSPLPASSIYILLGDAEKVALDKNKMFGYGFRLSCQIIAEDGMNLTVGMPVNESEWDKPGPRPADTIEPTEN